MSAPEDVVRLAEQRAAARAARDFTTADALRDRIEVLGWLVHDAPDGFSLDPAPATSPERPRPVRDVDSVLDRPATFDVAVHWLCEGWPDDLDRALRAFRRVSGDRRVQFVIADVTGEAAERWRDDDDVEVLSLEPDTGWAAARNAGLRRSLAPTVVAVDGSVEPLGDVFGPLEATLSNPAIGVCGPFGIDTGDLREFVEAPDAGPCDAIEGYLMAFRREVLTAVGGFDEKFRWYRTADIDWSFRVKEAGYRCEVTPVPVAKHEHRMWAAATDEQRVSWSKRNFYRFLDRYRDRWDLILAGKPEDHDHDHDHDDHHDQPVTMPEGR